MTTSKKQILLTFALTLCSLGIMASEADLKEKSARASAGYLARARGLFQRQRPIHTTASQIPPEIQKIIGRFAGEYTLFKTLNTPGSLVAFHDDGIHLTSAGFLPGSRETLGSVARVVTRNIIDGKITKDFTKELLSHTKLWLSGDGTIVMDSHNILETTTRDVLSKPPSIWTLDNWKYSPICLNHNGRIIALKGHHGSPIVLFDWKNKTRVDLPGRTNGIEYAFSPKPLFSRDGRIFACVSLSHDFILLFDAATGSEIAQIKTSISEKDDSFRDLIGSFYSDQGITSLAISPDNTFLAYSIALPNRSEAILVNRATEEIKKFPQQTSLLNRFGLTDSPHIERVGFTNTDNNMYTLSSEKKLEFRSLKTNSIYQTIQLPEADFSGLEALYDDHSIALSPDDQFLAVGYADAIQLFKSSTPLSEMIEKEEAIQKLRQQKKAREPIQNIETGIFRRSSPSAANVFYQAAMKQARQKKSAPVHTESLSPEYFKPAVEPLDENMPAITKPTIRPKADTTRMKAPVIQSQNIDMDATD